MYTSAWLYTASDVSSVYSDIHENTCTDSVVPTFIPNQEAIYLQNGYNDTYLLWNFFQMLISLKIRLRKSS